VEQDVPADWSPENAAWKTAMPGEGHASPIVWGDRVFTVAAAREQRDRMLVCLDRQTGEILWQQLVIRGPLEKLHQQNSYASGTPATDGERVYAVFRVGDEIVIAAHSFSDGEQLWMVRPGTHKGEWLAWMTACTNNHKKELHATRNPENDFTSSVSCSKGMINVPSRSPDRRRVAFVRFIDASFAP